MLVARRWKIPNREEMLQHWLLRPFARHLGSPLIWRFNRRGVARGMALGLFSGFAVPVAQTPFAAIFAVGARANLPVAALATSVTNPLTVPFIYFAAYLVGRTVLRMKENVSQAIAADVGFVERTISWIVTLAGPTYVGLLIFAVVSAPIGYGLVHIGWRIWVGAKWQRRKQRRAAAAAPAPRGFEA